MKYILVYAIVLLSLSVNGVLSGDFCRHKVHGNGKQIRGGFCSETIQGDVPSADKMTSTLIISPQNEALLQPNEPFSVDVSIQNLGTGFFSDPETQYYTKPQSLNGQGIIEGHTHVTIQRLSGDHPPDARKFDFFKGLNDKAKKGTLSVDVIGDNGKAGLPIGRYRVCTMSSSFAHQPLLMPIAKRGSQDDCIRINVGFGPEKGKGINVEAKSIIILKKAVEVFCTWLDRNVEEKKRKYREKKPASSSLGRGKLFGVNNTAAAHHDEEAITKVPNTLEFGSVLFNPAELIPAGDQYKEVTCHFLGRFSNKNPDVISVHGTFPYFIVRMGTFRIETGIMFILLLIFIHGFKGDDHTFKKQNL
ncbi:ribosomal protein s17 protein [Rhizophagus clarus]|uniref:Ribosomal protein s17 protein n=1 Tax=Rhizophagus clarus TaxID=94130 RepID=A0A8H3LNU5_9GLOM|nr:ribosomal protein s17 protein [Rhizophagus clarus]